MSVEALKGILSSGNTEESGGGTGVAGPLKEFKGKLKEITIEERTFQDGRTGKRLKFGFVDLEVIQATEVYAHSIFTLELSINPEVLAGTKKINTKSRLGHLLSTAQVAAGTDVDMTSLEGKYLHMQVKEGPTKIWHPPTSKEIDVESWQSGRH